MNAARLQKVNVKDGARLDVSADSFWDQDTVPLNYNFIFTCVSMCGAMRNLQISPSCVCVNTFSHTMEHSHLV